MDTIHRLPLDIDSILVQFNLPHLRSGELLDQWLMATGILTTAEQERLEKLHRKTLKSGMAGMGRVENEICQPDF